MKTQRMKAILLSLILAVLADGCTPARAVPLKEEGVVKRQNPHRKATAILAITDEEMTKLEGHAQPLSEFAETIKTLCEGDFLLPQPIYFMAHVDSLIASIGAGKIVYPDYTEAETAMAAARRSAAHYRLVLSRWLWGAPRWKARGEFLMGIDDYLTWVEGFAARTSGDVVDVAVVDEVYDTLGNANKADKHQKSVIEMMVRRLDPVTKDRSRPNQLYERFGTWDPPDPANIAEQFFHDITRLDFDTWKIVPNIQAMIRNVAAKSRVAEVHCWIGNPKDIPSIGMRVKALRSWFDGEAEETDTLGIAALLGSPKAYKEKRWLAASLLNRLINHLNDESVLRLLDPSPQG